MDGKAAVSRGAWRVALCVGLSVAVHVALVWWLWSAMAREVARRGTEGAAPPRSRVVQVLTPEQRRELPFAKTDPDAPEQAPKEADFVGRRDQVASETEFRPARREDAPVPTQNGVEREELVTFDQDAQEGDLAADGRRESPPRVSAPAGTPVPPAQAQPDTEGERVDTPANAGMASVAPPPPDEEGDVREEREAEEELTPEQPPQVQPQVAAEAEATLPAMNGVPVYDPALAEHMQQRPGFRTRERRTRSTGRFVIGKRPSLNVASTPRGRYEEEIYRRIAYIWYQACDEHRGDIIPGSVVVSLRISSRGLLENMELVRRKGASVIQQAFTFGAIRRATLPPMPPQVQQELVGDLLELIFQFNFD